MAHECVRPIARTIKAVSRTAVAVVRLRSSSIGERAAVLGRAAIFRQGGGLPPMGAVGWRRDECAQMVRFCASGDQRLGAHQRSTRCRKRRRRRRGGVRCWPAAERNRVVVEEVGSVHDAASDQHGHQQHQSRAACLDQARTDCCAAHVRAVPPESGRGKTRPQGELRLADTVGRKL